MKNTATAINEIRARIRAAETRFGRKPDSVRLLAVSKTKPAELVLRAIECGQTEFAENYVQEAVEKITRIGLPELTWHFIGPVQSNKTKPIAARFDWVHSLDRLKIAERLNAARPDHLPPLEVCLQVNISHEASKSGMSANELDELAMACNELPRLRLRGLMALPAPVADFDQQRQSFYEVKMLLVHLKRTLPELDTLSMGTTQDMEAAIAEGATMVRIGTALFGPRE